MFEGQIFLKHSLVMVDPSVKLGDSPLSKE
jgi:hypothetical protein